MDAQRALLDSLMGLNRDGDRPDDATLDFKHPKVCKSYLCGLCPRELFQNTRLDTGACELLHVPALRSAFQQQVDKRDFGYERQLANELSKLLADVERKITRAQKRLDEDGDNQDKMQIMQLTQDMQDSAAQAEQAAKNGNADKSLQLMEQVEQLKAKRRELLRECNAAGIHTNGVAMMVDNVNQKLRVCDVCGAFLSIFDSDQRLADHFAGKIHVGYVQIRKKLKELMTAMKDRKDDIPKGRRVIAVVVRMIEIDPEVGIGREAKDVDVIVIVLVIGTADEMIAKGDQKDLVEVEVKAAGESAIVIATNLPSRNSLRYYC
ncbi:hypothetical protein PsorP6_004645 [Peronosclerospora sorghi]|uniref:Uncharacterized protein n=1 Tax=Peronosclerospora sorghi TaxID=230839 RepID=A0ACC0VM95_9STRA|nr:hypothetical protein PsorP6_004645 [Peronosclerospora sorghi]